MGFSAIMVCRGFNTVVSLATFNMISADTVYSFSMALPAAVNRDSASFFEGINVAAAASQNCRNVDLVVNFNYTAPTKV